MLLSRELIAEYGPIIIVFVLAYNVVPLLVSKVMEGYTRTQQANATVTEAPYKLAQSVLETSLRDREMMYETFAKELIGIKSEVKQGFEEVNKRIDELIKGLSK